MIIKIKTKDLKGFSKAALPFAAIGFIGVLITLLSALTPWDKYAVSVFTGTFAVMALPALIPLLLDWFKGEGDWMLTIYYSFLFAAFLTLFIWTLC